MSTRWYGHSRIRMSPRVERGHPEKVVPVAERPQGVDPTSEAPGPKRACGVQEEARLRSAAGFCMSNKVISVRFRCCRKGLRAADMGRRRDGWSGNLPKRRLRVGICPSASGQRMHRNGHGRQDRFRPYSNFTANTLQRLDRTDNAVGRRGPTPMTTPRGLNSGWSRRCSVHRCPDRGREFGGHLFRPPAHHPTGRINVAAPGETPNF